MDRISDSGSDGCGSIPHGGTKLSINALASFGTLFYAFFCSKIARFSRFLCMFVSALFNNCLTVFVF